MFRSLLLLLLLIITLGCQNEDQESVQYNEVIQLRESDFSLEELSQSIYSYWTCARSSYTLDEICGCDCSSISLISEIQLECGDNLHEDFIDFHANLWDSEFECDELRNKLRPSCSYNSADEFERAILEAFALIPQINEYEADLVELIFKEDRSTFDINLLREKWYNLPRNTVNQNIYSATVLEVTNSYFIHINEEEEEGVILGAPWKPATIAAGAAWGFVSSFVGDVISNGECGSCSDLSLQDVAISTGLGALGGAMY